MKRLATLGLVIGALYLSERLSPENFSGKEYQKKSKPKSKTNPRADGSPLMQPRTLAELKRWGAWLKRTYGRKRLPPMREHGTFSAYALAATAWGCNPPRDERDARRLCSRGEKALEMASYLARECGHGWEARVPSATWRTIMKV